MSNILVFFYFINFCKALFAHIMVLMMKLFALNAKPNIQLLIIIAICQIQRTAKIIQWKIQMDKID